MSNSLYTRQPYVPNREQRATTVVVQPPPLPRLTLAQTEVLQAIRERQKEPWRVVTSRHSEIEFLISLIDGAYYA